MDERDWLLLRVAKRQEGVVSFAQARAVGFTSPAMRWRLETGEWVKILRSVVRLYWADDTWAARCHAAVVQGLPSQIGLSHFTAARWHGFDVASDGWVHVSTAQDVSRVRSDWLKSHGTVHLDFIEVDGLSVTKPSRTLLDLASMLSHAELERVTNVALRSGQVSPSEMRDEFSRWPKHSARVCRLREVLKRLVRV